MKNENFLKSLWQEITFYFKGPTPCGDYLLVIIDYYMKFIEKVIHVFNFFRNKKLVC